MSESMMLSGAEMMMMGGLAAPKGLQVVDDLGLIIVADLVPTPSSCLIGT